MKPQCTKGKDLYSPMGGGGVRPRLENTIFTHTNVPLGGSPPWHTGPKKKMAQKFLL